MQNLFEKLKIEQFNLLYKYILTIHILKDTRNTVHRTTMSQSPSKQAPWDLTQFSQLPSAAPSYFTESHQQCKISSLSKVILLWGKARSHRASNLCCRGAESPGRFDVSPKNSKQDMMHEWAHYGDEAQIRSGLPS